MRRACRPSSSTCSPRPRKPGFGPFAYLASASRSGGQLAGTTRVPSYRKPESAASSCVTTVNASRTPPDNSTSDVRTGIPTNEACWRRRTSGSDPASLRHVHRPRRQCEEEGPEREKRKEIRGIGYLPKEERLP